MSGQQDFINGNMYSVLVDYVFEKQTKLVGPTWYNHTNGWYEIDAKVKVAEFINVFPYIEIAKGKYTKTEDTDVVMQKLVAMVESLVAANLQKHMCYFGVKANKDDFSSMLPSIESHCKYIDNSTNAPDFLIKSIINIANSLFMVSHTEYSYNLQCLFYVLKKEFGIKFPDVVECITGESISKEQGEQLVMEF